MSERGLRAETAYRRLRAGLLTVLDADRVATVVDRRP
jgi:hypothetical protein